MKIEQLSFGLRLELVVIDMAKVRAGTVTKMEAERRPKNSTNNWTRSIKLKNNNGLLN